MEKLAILENKEKLLEEEMEKNRKGYEHLKAMIEATKGATTAKSQASYTAIKDALEW